MTPSLARERLRALKRGGIARIHRAATLPANTPDHPLGSVADVLSLLEQTGNAVRRGELNPVSQIASLIFLPLHSTDCRSVHHRRLPVSFSSFACRRRELRYAVLRPGQESDGTDCIACRGTGTLDLSDVAKSEASVN